MSIQTPSRPAPELRLPRFNRVERYAHWCTATLMLILLFTGFSLYAGPLSQIVGRRLLVRTVHFYAGLLLPIPVLVAISLRAGGQLREDLGRLNRWSRDDRAWWSKRRRGQAQLGKFNPGQKLNATFIGAAMLVMFMTGMVLKFYGPFSDSWRQGATFVHDWFAIGLLFAIIGHITLAFRDPEALNGMTHGWVKPAWARINRPRWYAEMTASPDGAAATGRLDSAGPAASADGSVAFDAVGDAGARVAHDAPEVGLRTGEVPVVDAVDGGAGDGVDEREL
jgi:formate dehydrogenase subunit gamma